MTHNRIGRRLLAAACACLAACLLVGEAKAALTLVEDGVSRAPIVVFEDAPPYTRQAAEELAEYIEKSTGARPEVLVGEPNPIPGRAIWVGYQPALDRLFPGVDFDFSRPEETLIVASENHLAIAGRDRWDPEHLVVEGRNWTIEGWQMEYGTANAVYTFIQEHLGVRWLWPGEMGEDVPERRRLSFAPFEERYHPQFRSRNLFRLSALGDARGHSHKWARRQRLQLDSLRVPGGHGFTDWWRRFHEKHPEYFALQPDGTRSGFPGPGTTKICLSNPAVWRQVLADIEESLERNPTRTSFNLHENDSHSRAICICQNCLAWDHPDGAPWRYAWEGLTQGHVAMSERYIRFWNTIADMVKERFPERDDIVLFGYAYGPSKPPPVEAAFNEGILYGYVGHWPFRNETGRQGRQEEKAEMAKWAEIAPEMLYRPNLWLWGGNLGLPEVAMSKTIEDFRFLAEHRCVGLWVDTCWEHWVTQLPQYYVMAQLTWNPRLDGHAALDDYYRRGFGPAAEEVRQYWEMWEDAYDGLSERGSPRRPPLPVFRETFPEDFLDRAEALLDRAEEKVAGERDIYRERIAFVRAGLDYVRLFLRSSEALDAARMGDADAQEVIAANWQEIERIFRDHPIALSRRTIQARAGWLVPQE